MKPGRIATLGIVFLILGMARAMAEEAQRRYVETHGNRTQVVQYGVVRSADGFVVSSVDPRSTETGRWVTGTGLVTWQQKDPSIGNDLVGRRTGRTILLSGTLAGKPVSREVRIDDAPWYQIFGPAISDLLPRGMDRQEFWVVDPSDLSAHKMLVRRAGTETIELNGSRVAAEKIHFSPAGALAPFWGADFWYREPDSIWIYSRLPEDGGTTVSTLQEAAR
jgi:hypothetical protein